jgi:hypothetical protein
MPTALLENPRSRERSVDSVDGLRFRALEVGRALAPVESLWSRTEVLSLNARIVAMKLGTDGLPFAIVAGAVNDLGKALAELVDEIEAARAGIVHGVASYTRDERNLLRILAAVGADGSAHGVHSSGGTGTITFLERKTGERWRQWYLELEPGVLDRDLLLALIDQRAHMAITLSEVHRLALGLDRATGKVQRLADLHGHFIGINALTEASHLRDGESALRSLGTDLYRLTRDMAAVIATASVEATALVRLAGSVRDHLDLQATHLLAGGER